MSDQTTDDQFRKATEMVLTATNFRNEDSTEHTLVNASCKCGRGGWIKLQKHPMPNPPTSLGEFSTDELLAEIEYRRNHEY